MSSRGKAAQGSRQEHARKPQKALGGKSPLEYMLDVMNDDAAEDARPDLRMSMPRQTTPRSGRRKSGSRELRRRQSASSHPGLDRGWRSIAADANLEHGMP